MNMQESSCLSDPSHQDMSNEANVNVSVGLSLVKSEFVVTQFTSLLPAPWMLCADVSDKHFPRQRSAASAALNAAPSLCIACAHHGVPTKHYTRHPGGISRGHHITS